MDNEKQKPHFVNERARSEIVPLSGRSIMAAKVYKTITVSRMTAAQVDQFVEAVKVTGAKTQLPMFDAPPEVIEALDADDSARVNEVVSRFLPRGLAPVETPSQIPSRHRPDGGDTCYPAAFFLHLEWAEFIRWYVQAIDLRKR